MLLLTVLYAFSFLSTIFNNNPAGRIVESSIWAGYVVSRNYKSQLGVTSVEASWTVPQVNTSVGAGEGYSSAWIGIGGQTEKTLIQVGTEQDFVDGHEIYVAWYETLPSLSVTINELTIAPGDTIVASLNLTDFNANLWNIKISDKSNGQTFNLNVNYNSSRTSGEWIVERPSINNQTSTLCDFGTVSFTNCLSKVDNVEGGIGNFSYSKIEMTNTVGVQLVSISPLSPDSSSFSVSYLGINKIGY